MENVIEKAINEEIEKRIIEFKLDYNNNKEIIEKQKEEINILTNENLSLKTENEELKSKSKVNNFLYDNINADNVNKIINIFEYSKTDYLDGGSYEDRIPNVFKLIFEYYKNKEDILNICDNFGIAYPEWFKNYKMPYDYDEKAVKIFIKHLDNAYVCNGCIYDDNIGFFYRELSQFDGDECLLIKSQYNEIPWQLFLKNPLLQQEDIWNSILKSIKGNKEHSYYFYKIDTYQKLSEEKIVQLFNIAIKSRFDEAKSFINRHTELIHKYPEIECQYKDKISYGWSDYHYSLFSKEIRDEYLLLLDFYELVSALKDSKCNLTELEKKELINKSAERKFR